MNTRTENKILKLMTELEKALDNAEEKTVEHFKYTQIKRLQDSINYKLNDLIQCDEEADA